MRKVFLNTMLVAHLDPYIPREQPTEIVTFIIMSQ